MSFMSKSKTKTKMVATDQNGENEIRLLVFELPIGWAEDRCAICGKHLGYGLPDYHLGDRSEHEGGAQ